MIDVIFLQLNILLDKVSSIVMAMHWSSLPFFLLDVAIVSIIFYFAYIFLHETRAMRILYGILILVALALIGRVFNLILLNWILKYLSTMLVVAIPIVFQPELRTILERLGRARFIRDLSLHGESAEVIDEVVKTVVALSKQRIGGLIVIQRQTGLKEYTETAAPLDAVVTKDLLLSIFSPRSPLHDGAVVISEDKIIAARTILPVSETLLSPSLGTRHKAGLGIAELSDAVALIVSEETGSISIAVGGKLERRIAEDRLVAKLKALLRSSKK